MGFIDYRCCRNSLVGLNVFYILVAFILIGVAAAGKGASIVTSMGAIGGVIACGIFLLVLSLVGIYGAVKHHQIMLFFYMVILFLVFLLQFSLACACLAMKEDKQLEIVRAAWGGVDKEKVIFNQIEKKHDCCSLDNVTGDTAYKCEELPCCEGQVNKTCEREDNNGCYTCWEKFLKDEVNAALKATGGVGLFFGFLEIAGIFIAFKYRNMMDPRADPGAFQ